MKIFLAEYAGFCFGVKRAVEMAEKEVASGPLHTWGPLIHNPQEVARLKEHGIIPIISWEEAKLPKVLIRTHGVGPQVFDTGKNNNTIVVNGTCPYVTKLQRLAQDLRSKKYQIVILGDINHPEIQGIMGWVNYEAQCINNLDEIQSLELDENNSVALLAQTTEPQEKFAQALELLQKRYPKTQGFNTICSATQQRQESALNLAKKVDVMIVVGGFDSANTKKLTKLCQDIVPTYQIERAVQLKKEWLYNIKRVGLTAGASTPHWIIEEVINVMEELKGQENQGNVEEFKDMESAMAEYMDYGFGEIKRGKVITGTVVQVKNDEVLVDVGGKSEGVIPVAELAYRRIEEPKEFIKVGDRIKVVVLKLEDREGNMILSKRRAEQEESFEKLEKAFENQEIIEAEVVDVVKGGLLVDLGVRCFVPASLMELGFVEDLKQYVGKTYKFKIVDLDSKKKSAVLSRKPILEKESEMLKKQTWNEIAEGQTRKGIVKRLTNFGAFVDLGGVDGLLHVSEMGWARINKPEDIVKIGDEVEVFVIAVDKDKEKVGLSLKKLTLAPWELATEKFPVGSIVTGKVVRIAPFGAFVEVIPGVDGLIHISQISNQRINKVEDALKVGQEVVAKVIELDVEAKKMSLSIKEAVNDKENKEAESFIQEKQNDINVTIGDAVENNIE